MKQHAHNMHAHKSECVLYYIHLNNLYDNRKHHHQNIHNHIPHRCNLVANHFIQDEMIAWGTNSLLFHKHLFSKHTLLVVVDKEVGAKEASKNSISVLDRHGNDECKHA